MTAFSMQFVPSNSRQHDRGRRARAVSDATSVSCQTRTDIIS